MRGLPNSSVVAPYDDDADEEDGQGSPILGPLTIGQEGEGGHVREAKGQGEEQADCDSACAMMCIYHVTPEVYEQFYPETRVREEEAPMPDAPGAAPSRQQATSQQSNSRACDVTPQETIIFDRHGSMFSAADIYGLGSTAGQERVPASGKMESIQGGEFVKEECVVCLTEQKVVVLLPCRHLCVCASCLIYVDKCPVCRAFFQEYVVIQCPTGATSTQDSSSPGNSDQPVITGLQHV
jgi:hypothetical protein